MLYTIGYQALKGADDIVAIAANLDAIVVDTRFQASSRNAAWRQGPLQKRLGERYVHAEGFGNRNYRGGPIELVDPEPWYARIIDSLSRGDNIVLLCACSDLESCHRKVVADEIERRTGDRAVHLGADWRSLGTHRPAASPAAAASQTSTHNAGVSSGPPRRPRTQ